MESHPGQCLAPHEAVAVARALTGQQIDLDATNVAGLLTSLAAAGWNPEQLQQLRRNRQQLRQPWPFAVPLEQLRAIGFARFDALLADVRQAAGLEGLAPAQPAIRPLNPAEQRIVADRPPHW